MNLLNDQLEELDKLKISDVNLADVVEGVIRISDAKRLLEDFDNKWWTTCSAEMNKIREEIEPSDVIFRVH